MFELLAMICIEGLCQERLLPAPAAMTETACLASASRADEWAALRDGATVKSTRCAALAELFEGAASVVEVKSGAFVHEGLIEDTTRKNAGDVSNHGFIVGETSVAVIDAGYSRALGEALYLAIRMRTGKPISHVLFTHMHPDHTLGGDVFIEAGAEALAAPKFQSAYQNRVLGYIDAQARLIGSEAAHATYGEINAREVTEETINIGNRPLHLRTYQTAHTTNDMTVLDEATETIWMGDLTFLGHTPALDGSIRGWIALLNNLEAGVAQYIVPGHGPALVAYPDGAHPTLNYLKGLAAAMRSSIAKGESLQEALKDDGAAIRAEWKLWGEFHLRNATNAYIELEWE